MAAIYGVHTLSQSTTPSSAQPARPYDPNMIQIGNTEKAAIAQPPPPSYTPIANGQAAYPPPQQQQQPYNVTVYAPSPPIVMSPAMSPGMHMNQEAAIGTAYQQQLYARCARGEHDVEKKYGPCGIVTAIVLFPIGLLALLVDVEKKCARCGVRLA